MSACLGQNMICHTVVISKVERGDARQAVTALIVANEFLEAQVTELQPAVSNGYARGKFEPVPSDRKD
jgi:hypothetical protein